MDATAGKIKSRKRDTGDSRAERKRVQDRLAQRATRERTKNRIAYLEQRLSSLEAGNKHSEISHLARVIDDLRCDNNRLRNALVKIRTAIDQTVLATDEQNSSQPDGRPCDCSTQDSCACEHAAFPEPIPAGFGDHIDGMGHHSTASTGPSEPTDLVNESDTASNTGGEPLNEAQPDMLQDFFDFNPNTLLEMFEYGAAAGYNTWQSRTPSPFDYRFPATIVKVAPDLEKWEVSNGAFIHCLDSVKKKTASNSTLDMHVPFKAAIWGWENVGPEANHPVWSALRQVDQRVFGTWTSKAQRIALMYVCQTLIQYRERPTEENFDRVPVFLRPRPSQGNIQHPAVIDFLIW